MATRISMHRFHREVDPAAYGIALQKVQDCGYRLLISGANKAYFDALGVDAEEVLASKSTGLSTGRRFVQGDLVPAKDWSEVAYIGLVQEFGSATPAGPNQFTVSTGAPRHFLEVGSISSGGPSDLLDPIKGLLAASLGEDGTTDAAWGQLAWSNKGFDELAGAGSFQRPDFSRIRPWRRTSLSTARHGSSPQQQKPPVACL